MMTNKQSQITKKALKLFLKMIIVLTVIIFKIEVTYADQRETTVDAFEDSDFKFYDCLGEDQDSETKAFENAVNECYRSAISDNFGMSTQIQHSSLESDYGSKIKIKKELLSKKVELKSFEKIQQKTIRDDKFIKIYLKYRYKKSEILKEQLRLSQRQTNISALGLETDFESESISDLKYNTEFIIRTRPSKSKVFINGEMMGFSNLNLKNILLPQKYLIKIEKENFQTVEIYKDLTENKLEIIDLRLKPKMLNLYFDLEPKNANLYIDGKLIKNNILQVEAGKVMQIRIAKSDCITQEYNNYQADEKFGLLFEVKLKCREEPKPQEISPVSDSAYSSAHLRANDLSIGFGVVGMGFVSGSSKLFRLTTLNVGYATYLKLDNVYFEYQFSQFEKGKYEYVSTGGYDIHELVAMGSHQKFKFSATDSTGQMAVGLVYLNTEFKDQMPLFSDKQNAKMTSVKNLKSYGGSFELLQPSISKYLILKGALEILITPVPSSDLETSWGLSLGLYLNLNLN